MTKTNISVRFFVVAEIITTDTLHTHDNLDRKLDRYLCKLSYL